MLEEDIDNEFVVDDAQFIVGDVDEGKSFYSFLCQNYNIFYHLF